VVAAASAVSGERANQNKVATGAMASNYNEKQQSTHIREEIKAVINWRQQLCCKISVQWWGSNANQQTTSESEWC